MTPSGSYRAVCSCDWRDGVVYVPARFETGVVGAMEAAMVAGTAHRNAEKAGR